VASGRNASICAEATLLSLVIVMTGLIRVVNEGVDDDGRARAQQRPWTAWVQGTAKLRLGWTCSTWGPTRRLRKCLARHSTSADESRGIVSPHTAR
jgi:hypothetical protein